MKGRLKTIGITVGILFLLSCSSEINSGISKDAFKGKWVYSGPPDDHIENFFIFNDNSIYSKLVHREGTWTDVGIIDFTETEIILLEGYVRSYNIRAIPYRFEDGHLFLSFFDLRGWLEYRFTKQSNETFNGSAKNYDDFAGKWIGLLMIDNGLAKEWYFEFKGDNMFYRGLSTGWDQTWQGKFTFNDKKISLLFDEIVSWEGGSTGSKAEWLYWLDGNILTLNKVAGLNSTPISGTFTKR